jgi:hypothetical protein
VHHIIINLHPWLRARGCASSPAEEQRGRLVGELIHGICSASMVATSHGTRT